MGINNNQIDMFDSMIFEKLIPKDHLLVKIDSIIDFSFVYDLVKDFYSSIGRKSKDPVMMFKTLLLEYLYNLSDVKVKERIQTDIAFRWFLGLKIDDSTPDDSTTSFFRCHRLNENVFEQFFNEIVQKCIDLNIIKNRRFIVDSTNVDANVNYPKRKRLIEQSFFKVIKETEKYNKELALKCKDKFNLEIEKLYINSNQVRSKKHAKVALEQLEIIYLQMNSKLQNDEKYLEAYSICMNINKKTISGKSILIISVVDPDARVAHKTRGVRKRGYKDHIIVDEDSEIILAAEVTPFNVGDEKKLSSLVEKVNTNFDIKPIELSADKVYGTIDNRSYLLDNEIVSSIGFYNEGNRKGSIYGVNDFIYSDDLKSATCKNNITSIKYKDSKKQKDGHRYRDFKFEMKDCKICKLRKECLKTNADGKITKRFKLIKVRIRYDAVLNDKKRNSLDSYKNAANNRYKVERRFATLVRNNGLRRSRYIKLNRTTTHVILSNLACNVVRMVNIICGPKEVTSKTKK